MKQQIEVENINHPGTARQVDRAMYDAMKKAYLKVLPGKSPGLTLAEISERLAGELPQELYPGGAKAGWWAKTVQLDLEAKGLIRREKTSPIRLHKSVNPDRQGCKSFSSMYGNNAVYGPPFARLDQALVNDAN